MDEGIKTTPCEDCHEGGNEVHLQTEVEHLRQHLAERDSHIVALEGGFLKCNTRIKTLEEQVDTWRDKYERLYDSHKRVQKLNQVLEEKLLQMVDKMKSDKSQLTKDIATLSVRLAECKHNYGALQKENERYKNDMNLAIQLLQCKPDNFVSQKLDSLPVDTQARVSQYVMAKTTKSSSSVHSKNGNENDTFDSNDYEFNISASLMSKILEDSIQDTVTKHCDTCTCILTQNKPFSYNDNHYSVATQTFVSGDMKNSLCLHCNSDIKSAYSNASIGSLSPHGVRLINEKTSLVNPPTSLYIIPQQNNKTQKIDLEPPKQSLCISTNEKLNDKINVNIGINDDIAPEIAADANFNKKISVMQTEPAVHHKLCDRTKIPNAKYSTQSMHSEDILTKDVLNTKDTKSLNDYNSNETLNLRKNSVTSVGGVSRTSSIAKSTKSTVSTHKSNTQVGPGPRFCHLRVQAGSKNILLDNAQPDVPPILYRRQSRCNEHSLLKDFSDDNLLELDKNDNETQNENKNDAIVVESTLIDVHVDNNTKDDTVNAAKNSTINPILLNVSSSPLQPLKTHTFSNSTSENINNNNNNNISVTQTAQNDNTNPTLDNLLDNFDLNLNNAQNFNSDTNKDVTDGAITTENNDIKLFNFDRYEQSKMASQYAKPIRKIDMAQLHSLENTKISKDFPPPGNDSKIEKKIDLTKVALPTIVNVYPNLTQSHLKVNENKKTFTNEQSTSSLSSDDSAALLQKQQLLRVAEWVEQNLEQQNNLNDPLEEDITFSKSMRRESKLERITNTLNELTLNMPHPVSKYSKPYVRDVHNNWGNRSDVGQNQNNYEKATLSRKPSIVKETIFPVESSGETVTETSESMDRSDMRKEKCSSEGNLGPVKAEEVSAEELARMEYNVKKFLLSGPQWNCPENVGRFRRTSSKTETEV